MPRFEPFPGLRYDPDRVSLSEVIAPPYDVIGQAERQRLELRSAANAVRLELPEPDLAAGMDRYQVARSLLDRWMDRGIIKPDEPAAFYAYRMTTPEGASTTGVVGALEIGDEVLPHEQTLPKPRSDRLDLLRATRANLSPIWGLSMAGGLTETLPTGRPPTSAVHDDDGVLHELWVVDEEPLLRRIAATVQSAPVVLADGHHRYQVATTYRDELGGIQVAGDAALVMAFVVELSDDQVHVGAIHRTLSGLDGDLVSDLGRWFDVVRAGPASRQTVQALADAQSLALVTKTGAWLLTPRPEASVLTESELDTSLFALVDGALPAHQTTHRHTWQEVMEALEAGQADAGVLLRPVSVAQLTEWAKERRRMPPKSTFFFPKPRSGLVYRLLRG